MTFDISYLTPHDPTLPHLAPIGSHRTIKNSQIYKLDGWDGMGWDGMGWDGLDILYHYYH